MGTSESIESKIIVVRLKSSGTFKRMHLIFNECDGVLTTLGFSCRVIYTEENIAKLRNCARENKKKIEEISGDQIWEFDNDFFSFEGEEYEVTRYLKTTLYEKALGRYTFSFI